MRAHNETAHDGAASRADDTQSVERSLAARGTGRMRRSLIPIPVLVARLHPARHLA